MNRPMPRGDCSHRSPDSGRFLHRSSLGHLRNGESCAKQCATRWEDATARCLWFCLACWTVIFSAKPANAAIIKEFQAINRTTDFVSLVVSNCEFNQTYGMRHFKTHGLGNYEALFFQSSSTASQLYEFHGDVNLTGSARLCNAVWKRRGRGANFMAIEGYRSDSKGNSLILGKNKKAISQDTFALCCCGYNTVGVRGVEFRPVALQTDSPSVSNSF